jgi:UPF0755 protein
MKRTIISILLLLGLSVSLYKLGGMVSLNPLDRPIALSESQPLDNRGRLLWSIESGSSLSRVSKELYQLNIIPYPRLLTLWAMLFDKVSIQAGEYWIEPEDTALTLLRKFNRGQIVRYKITFPEGWNFDQWLRYLAEIPQFSQMASMEHKSILQALEIDIEHPEGWFFPDTYTYSKNNTAFDILLQAHRRMRIELDQAWQQRGPNLPYKTAYEALIMASIIEKETGLASERASIAGVFVRRLKTGMRLQTDPTVIYGMGDRFNGNLRHRDLQKITPYNTYRIDGLPPTPIAMPGIESIRAALKPAQGSSLYFVAKGDGSHHFSDTMSEHKRAVRQYQIEQRVEQYQSAPSNQ